MVPETRDGSWGRWPGHGPPPRPTQHWPCHLHVPIKEFSRSYMPPTIPSPLFLQRLFQELTGVTIHQMLLQPYPERVQEIDLSPTIQAP
uniref:uncharacterized protein LOC128931527 isoform X1 n=1 Tax=Callithrix jacchus TaxID=9483 RepID=UPI0023DD56D0|nr:uncharacterized protein LOC128931527 isoform X1 [Callithrix jacchus]